MHRGVSYMPRSAIHCGRITVILKGPLLSASPFRCRRPPVSATSMKNCWLVWVVFFQHTKASRPYGNAPGSRRDNSKCACSLSDCREPISRDFFSVPFNLESDSCVLIAAGQDTATQVAIDCDPLRHQLSAAGNGGTRTIVSVV